jgi:hypothetical protein
MSEATFTEAPASINVKFKWRGFDTMLTLRDVSGKALLEKMGTALDTLEKMGAKPNGYRGNGQNNSNGNNSEAPLCPTHNKPMKRSKFGNGWYCPVKIADDDGTGKAVYCKQKVRE